MIAAIDAPFADVRADGLRFSLDAPAVPALAARRVQLGPWSLELRVLGASHQVLAEGPGGPVRETVACRDDLGQAVPAALERPGYAFRGTVEVLAPEALRARAAELLAHAAADPLAVAGVFPGHDAALTALFARALPGDGAAWETHHLYPATGEALRTVTTVGPA